MTSLLVSTFLSSSFPRYLSVSLSLSQGGEAGPWAEDAASHLSSSSRVSPSPVRNPLSFRTMQAKVVLLDGSLFTCTLEVRQAGLQTDRHVGDVVKTVCLCVFVCAEAFQRCAAV